MIDPKEWEALYSLLFWNPWSSVEFLASMSGISASTIRRKLSNEAGIEAVEIPNQFGKNRKVYALKRNRQLSLFDLNMHPNFMAEALMMNFARLRAVRDLFSVLRQSGLPMSRVISPWRPGRHGSMFDGLAKVNTWNGNQLLLAVICGFQDLNLLGYEALLKAWGKWRKKTLEHPATLLLIGQSITKGMAKRLKEVSGTIEGDVVWYLSGMVEGDNRWIYLNGKDLNPIAIPPWGRGIGMSSENFKDLLANSIHPGVRATRHPRAETLVEWLDSNPESEIGWLTKIFLSLKPVEFEMLRWLVLFPALDRDTYVVLNQFVLNKINAHSQCIQNKFKQSFTQIIRNLQNQGLAAEIKPYPGHYAITPKGMLFFSLVVGLDAEEQSAAWSHPERVGKFSFQQSHQTWILKIIQQISCDGNLERIGTESNRLVYHDIRILSKNIKQIEIRPDVIATIRLNYRSRTFWIEVDRGTRKGKKIRWKLKKMFYIFYARVNPSPIMPILYVVACENGNHESRVHYIFNLLKKLYALFPDNPMHLLITTTDLLTQISGTFIEKPIWREFYLGRVQKKTRSLEDIFANHSH